jgi:hypothetical protein
MKTSNKILLGLLTTIFLFITAVFIDIRVFGVHRSERNMIKKTHNIDLGNYKYLKTKNINSLEIRPSANNHLNFIAYNDTVEFAIDYRIENDTLFLIGKKSPQYYTHYSLYTQSEIKSILALDSKIELKGLKQDEIFIKIDGGEAYCWGKDSLRLSIFKKCNISQVNSRLNLHNVKIDTLKIDMVKSRAEFVKNIPVLNATMNDKSNLQLRKVSEAKFTSDKSSRIYFH